MTERRALRRAAALSVIAAALVACGGSESSSSDTTAPPTTAGTSADEPAATTATSGPPTTAPDTTAPPTTAPPTTAPPTTAAPTTAPPTTVPPVTTPELDAAMVQFCFDSEQAYIANSLTEVLQDPTPAEARGALQFLVFTAETAAASAPEGLQAEPARFAELARYIDDLFDRYDYDTDALVANEDQADHEPVFDEFDMIADEQLEPFLSEVCGTPLDLLDDQAEKLAVVIGAAVEWPLVALASPVGDIRLLAPAAWNDTVGSPEPGEVTELLVSTDNAGYDSSWNVPGVRVTVFYVEAGTAEPSLRVAGLYAASDCAPIGSQPYQDPVYTGELFLYQSCAGTDTGAAVLAVTNDAGSIETYLEFQFPDGLDRELLDRMLATFVAGV